MKLLNKLVGANKYDVKMEKLEQKKKEKEKNEIELKNKSDNLINLVAFQQQHSPQIVDVVNKLCAETNDAFDKLDKVKSSKSAKSLKQKNDILSLEEKMREKLTYMYMVKDYLTYANMLLNGIDLQNLEKDMMIKFSPFFDGVQVLNSVKFTDDDNIISEFKSFGQEFKKSFGITNSTPKKFTFKTYIRKYENEIENLLIPDVSSLLNLFENFKQSKSIEIEEEPDKKCPSCGALVGSGEKFCFECGANLSVKRLYCPECGTELRLDAKFCSSCGYKIVK